MSFKTSSLSEPRFAGTTFPVPFASVRSQTFKTTVERTKNLKKMIFKGISLSNDVPESKVKEAMEKLVQLRLDNKALEKKKGNADVNAIKEELVKPLTAQIEALQAIGSAEMLVRSDRPQAVRSSPLFENKAKQE